MFFTLVFVSVLNRRSEPLVNNSTYIITSKNILTKLMMEVREEKTSAGYVSMNQSWGPYAGGRVSSPTLRRHSWRSRLASPHAVSLSIPSNSQQEASTCRSQEFCGRPLGLLQVGLSLVEATRQAGSASGYRALCPYSRSWR